jgi:lipopolysaccharide/colanic/teichoic acid biosynthesis glycosyltransferase
LSSSERAGARARRAVPYRGQRLFDLAMVAAAAIPAAVIGAVCAAAIKRTSPGPIFFRQERAGLHGRLFRVVKFRTMVDDPDGNPLFPDDDRITSAGRWLRRLSLDELPQLVNVAVGQMSIVGPRPTQPYQVERNTAEQRRRLDVRPGLTGLAQIKGRNAILWADRIEHDLEYVDRQSLWFDISLVLRTIPAVLGGGGIEGHPTDDPLAVLDPEQPATGVAR